jgi:hypothetical protein
MGWWTILDPAIMALDEYGIPVQVGQRLQQLSVSVFERELLEDARAHL